MHSLVVSRRSGDDEAGELIQNCSLSFVFMDDPFRCVRVTTAMRLIDAALRKRINVKVFVFKDAACLPVAKQKPHANTAYGTGLDSKHDSLPNDFIESFEKLTALLRLAIEHGVQFEWVSCGLYVDEHGTDEAIDGVRRGKTPDDLWQWVFESTNTLVVPAC